MPGSRDGTDSEGTKPVSNREEETRPVSPYSKFPPSPRWGYTSVPSDDRIDTVPHGKEASPAAQEAGRDESEQRAKSQRVRELEAELDRIPIRRKAILDELTELATWRGR